VLAMARCLACCRAPTSLQHTKAGQHVLKSGRSHAGSVPCEPLLLFQLHARSLQATVPTMKLQSHIKNVWICRQHNQQGHCSLTSLFLCSQSRPGMELQPPSHD
jgi:hypothetical protein